MKIPTFILLIGCLCHVFVIHAQSIHEIPSYDLAIYQQKYDKALQQLDSLLAVDSTDATLHLKKGIVFESKYNYLKAIESYRQAYLYDTLNIRVAARENMGDLFQRAGQPQKAIQAYKEVLLYDNHSLPVRNKLAGLLLKTDHTLEAVQIYLYLETEDPDNYYYKKKLGEGYQKLNVLFEAMRWYEQAHQQNPDDLEVVTRLANLHIKNNSYDQGLTLTRKASRLDSTYIPLAKLNAYLYMLNQKSDSAITSFEKVLVLGDSSAFVFKYLGLSHYQYGSIDASRKYLETSLEKDSLDSEAHYYYALALSETHHRQKSQEAIKKLLNLLEPPNETLVDIYSLKAENHKLMGEFAKAAELYLLLYEKDPKNTRWLLNAGYYYDKRLNNKKKARMVYEQYLQLASTDSALNNSPYTEVVRKRLREWKEEDFFEGKLK